MVRVLNGVVVAGCMMVLALPASADERKFTYSNEAKTLPAGSFEFEQWASLAARKESGTFRVWHFREEFEYGVTDRFNAAAYLNWEAKAIHDVPGLAEEKDARFAGISLEGKYKLTDASADPLGTLLYAEFSAEQGEYEIELKGVASKSWGDWTFAYNFIFETEWAGDIDPATGRRAWQHASVVENTAGVSYSFLPMLAVGIEALARTPWDDNFDRAQTAYFVGPNLHVAAGPLWGTLTFLRQVDPHGHNRLDLAGFEKYEVRLIVGINF